MMQFLKISWILFLIVCNSCAQTQPSDSKPAKYQIKDKEQFQKLASEPLYLKYGQVSSVKVIYEVSKQKMHIVPSYRFKYHYEYCMDVLGYRNDLAHFNIEAYSPYEEREFLLGNINYYQALDVYALEIGPSDRMTAKNIQLFFESLKNEVYFGNEMKFMLNTTHVEKLRDQLDIPFISPDEIYKNQVYQPISKYESKGRFIVIKDWEKQMDEIRRTDILLMDEIPAIFPPVSGIIVTKFQTPLSHVAILGQNRKIPVCAYRKIFDNEEIMSLDGQTVEFKVEQDTFYLKAKEINLAKLIKDGPPIELKADLSVDSLLPIGMVNQRSSIYVGNKAANFGELVRYSKRMDFKTPESAFAIPFYFYKKHLDACSGVRTKIDQLLSKDNFSRPRSEIEHDLLEIQNQILEVPLNEKFLQDVQEMILRLGDFTRMRFRSSTNAEDMDGFSGAGLYTSKMGELGNEMKPIDMAIKKVWASMWSYGAFMERESFNIDHRNAYMGILVHRSFPEEEVNGVAITTNLYRNDYLGFVVNAQIGDLSVVNPGVGIECDQIICYPDRESPNDETREGGVDIINFSNQNNGELVMSEEEYQHLANVLEDIKSRYTRTHFTRMSYFNFALDIEFKLDGETRELYIKQMRVFNR